MSRWRLAPGVRRLADRRLAGGAPFRVIRLSAAGEQALAELLDTEGEPADGTPAGRLAERLAVAGMLLPPVRPPADLTDVTVVVPARSTAATVNQLLRCIPAGVPVIVVDDGSARPLAGQLTPRTGLTVLRHEVSAGPAQARNAGAAEARTDFVAFVDTDIRADGCWLAALRGQVGTGVVAVAPRITSTPAAGLAGLIETYSPGLDLGPTAGDVRLAGPLTYLPSAVLLVRRAAFGQAGGFDARLRVAEDVDLIWRLLPLGRVRYEPAVMVRHAPGRAAGAVLRRRFAYGTGAALIEERHPRTLRHAEVSVRTLVPWLIALLVGVRPAALACALTVGGAPVRLPELPAADALVLAARGQWRAARVLGRWLIRPMCPVTVAAFGLVPRRRGAMLAAVAAGLTPLLARAGDGTPAAPGGARSWPARLVAGMLDDVAYSLGVWAGCLRRRRLSPLTLRIHRAGPVRRRGIAR